MIDVTDVRSISPEVLDGWLLELAENLRPSDLDEIAATSALSPLDSLRLSVGVSSLCWVATLDSTPLCIFGVSPTAFPGAGSVWMLGTPGMDRARLGILRLTRRYLDEMHHQFPLLWNDIDARNERSMDWLRWCGFRLLEAHPEHGREGRLFFTFARYAPHV